MASEEDILKKFNKLKDNKQFVVPNDYFESFADKVMDKIENEEVENEKPVIRLSLVRKSLSWAASFAALFLITYAGISLLFPSEKSEFLSSQEIYAALESDIDYLDENQLFNMVTIPSKHTTFDDIELSEEEILNYLIEENTEIDLLNTDF